MLGFSSFVLEVEGPAIGDSSSAGTFLVSFVASAVFVLAASADGNVAGGGTAGTGAADSGAASASEEGSSAVHDASALRTTLPSLSGWLHPCWKSRSRLS